MNIIIVGCGKVGYTLADQLCAEGHDITVVDNNPAKVAAVTDNMDVIGLVGNGISHQVLLDAGAADADLFIAVTGDDEKNLLSCMIAKRTGNCQTIARVRDPLYNKEIEFLKKNFDLAMIVNPEMASAAEIARIFQFPSAISVDSFAKGHADLLSFKIPVASKMDGLVLKELHSTIGSHVLVCTVERDDDVFIPNGSFIFHGGDIVSIVAERKNAVAFFDAMGIMKRTVKNAMLAGGSKVAFYLARELVDAGIHTTIIEKDMARCEELCDLIPKATIINGDATDQALLREEGIATIQGFAALTGIDEENILLSLYANQVSDENTKTVTKIGRISFQNVINKMNLGSIIYPRDITAESILRHVRSQAGSMNSCNVENLYKLANNKAEALEFNVSEGSPITGKTLAQLHLKPNTLLCAIYRDGKVILPNGSDTVHPGDSVLVVIAGYRVNDIKDIMEG